MNINQIKATIAELQAIVDEQETILISQDGIKLKDQDACFIVRFSPNSNTWEVPLTKKMSLELANSIKGQKLMCFATEKDANEFYNSQPRINENISASVNIRIYSNGTIKFSDGVNYFNSVEFNKII